MEFSDKLRHGGPGQPAPLALSPDGAIMASTQDLKVELREVDSLRVLQQYTSLDVVQHMEWSPDSKYLACGVYKRGLIQVRRRRPPGFSGALSATPLQWFLSAIVGGAALTRARRRRRQVWSAEENDWKCKIDAGAEGVMHMRWSPDSRHVVTIAEFNLRATVWSLLDKTSVAVPMPKHAKTGLDFSADGEYMAVAHRQDGKDVIRIYSTETWLPVSEFYSDTVDMIDLAWSPNGRMLAVWDCNLHYNVLVYSMDGRRLEHYSACAPNPPPLHILLTLIWPAGSRAGMTTRWV